MTVTGASTTLAFNRTDIPAAPFVVNNNQISGSAGAIPKIVVNSGAVQLGGNADNAYATATVKTNGTLILAKTSNANAHVLGGNSLIESGGTMQLGASGTGGDQIYTGVVVTNLGVFDLNSMSEAYNNLVLSGTGNGSGALINSTTSATSTNTSLVTLIANSSIGGAGNLTLPGVISGTGFSVTKVGAGTVTLSGANTFSGPTTNTAGTLDLNNQLALQNSTLTMIGGGPITLDSAVAGKAFTLGGLVANTSGAGYDLGLTNTAGAAVAITIGNNNASTTCAGVLSAAGSLLKNGTGTLTLSGTNTYSGATTVSAGTLALGGSGQLGGGTYAAVITNSGTLNYNSSAAQTLSGIISGAGALVESGPGTLTLSGVETYTGATTVKAGTLLVNSPGSLAAGSAVTVNSGTLGGSGTINGTVNLLAGSQLAPGGVNTVGTLTMNATNIAALTLNGNILLMDLAGVAGTSDRVVTPKTNVVNNANTIALSFPNGTNAAGTNTLMTYAAKTGTGTFALLGGYPNAYLVTTTTNVLLVVTNTSTYGLTWNGNLSGTWDTTVSNWLKGASGSAFTTGDAVTFDDTATGNLTVSGATLTPGSVTFNNSTKNYTNSAVIAGSGGLLKLGSATALLSGSNTFSGGAFINGGTLALSGGANRLATATTVNFGGAATLDLGGNSQTLGNLNNANGVTNFVKNGNLIMTASGGFNPLNRVGVSSTLDMSGLSLFTYNQSGQTFTAQGQAVSGGQTFSMYLAGSNAVNTITAANVQVGNGGGANVPTGNLYLGQTNIFNTANLQLGAYQGSGNVYFQSGLANSNVTFRGTAGGSTRVGTITILSQASGTSQTDTMDLGSATVDGLISTFTMLDTVQPAIAQTATVNFGNGIFDITTLNLAKVGNAVVGTANETASFNQSGGLAKIQTINFGLAAGSFPYLYKPSYTLGSGATLAVGNITAAAGMNFHTNTVRNLNLNGGTVSNYDASTDLTISGVLSTNTLGAGGLLNLVLGAGTTNTFNAGAGRIISLQTNAYFTGSGALNKTGAGTLALDFTNAGFTGKTLVTGGSVKIVGSDTALGAAPGSVTADQLTLDGGTLSLNQGWAGSWSYFSPGSGYTSLPSVSLSQVTGAKILAVGNVLSAGDVIPVAAQGSGITVCTVYFSPPDQVGGVTPTATSTIVGGKVTQVNVVTGGTGYTVMPQMYFAITRSGGADATPPAVTGTVSLTDLINVNPGYDFTGTAPTVSFTGGGGSGASVSADTTATAAINLAANRGLTLGAGGGTIEVIGNHAIKGVITGSGALTKTGTGMLTLTNANNYSGGTTISAGTLWDSGQVSPNSGTGTNTVAVNVGGQLSGNGRLGGAVTVANNGAAVLYPSNSLAGGTLTLGGNLTFGGANAGVRFDVDSSATSGLSDKVVLENKTLSCGGAQITINSAGYLDTATDYVLFDAGASGTISGSFNNIPLWSGATPYNAANYTVVNVGNTNVVLRYSSSTPLIGVGAASPSTGVHQPYLLTVTVTSGSPIPSTGINVTANLSSIGGLASQVFYDDGTHGDVSAGDNVFTLAYAMPGVIATGLKTLPFTVTDAEARTASSSITLTIVNGTLTWDGAATDDNWSSLNWSAGDSLAFTNDLAVFTGYTRLTPVLDTNYIVAGLAFDSGASGFNITATGASTLTLSAAGTGVTNDSSSEQTLNVPVILGAAQTFNAASANLVFSNTVNNAGNLLRTLGANSVVFAGAVSGGGGLVVAGTGTTLLAANNSYTGITTVSNGVLQVGNGGTAGTLGTSNTVNNAGLVFNRTDASSYGGAVSGTGGLTNIGAGTLTLSGASTYAGDTTISSGSIKGGAASVLPSGAGKGNLVLNPASGTATFDLGGFNQSVNGLTSSGAGTSVMDNTASSSTNTLTVGNNNTTSTYNGIITNSVGVLNLAKAGTGTLTLTGPLANSGNVDIAGTSGSIELNRNTTYTLAQTFSGTVTLKIDVGTVDITSPSFTPTLDLGANTAGTSIVNWTGTGVVDGFDMNNKGTTTFPTLNIMGGGSITVSNANASAIVWPSWYVDAVWIAGKGNATLNLTNGGILTLAKNKRFMVGISKYGGSGAKVATIDIFTNSVFEAQGSPAPGASSTNDFWLGYAESQVAAGGSLFATTSTLRLDGGKLKTSRTVKSFIDSGVLVPTATLVFNGGTLQANAYDNTNWIDASITTVTNDLGGANLDTAGQTMTISHPIIGAGGLTKTGLGTLYLNGTNTYTGVTTVSQGALGGTGNLASAVTVQASAMLSPGASIGTLTISNDLALAGNLFIEVNKTLVQSNDYVVVTGGLTNSGTGTVTVTNLDVTALVVGDKFTLFSHPLVNGNMLTIVGGGVTWQNNLAVDGSIQVIPTSTTSSNAYLTGLTLSPVQSFTPNFDSNTPSYLATENYGVPFTVTVTNGDANATNVLTYNGGSPLLLTNGVASGSLSLNVNPGVTNTVSVAVTAQDGITTKTYAVNVVQIPSQTPPKLTNSVSGGNLVLNWDLAHTGYRLLTQTSNISKGVSKNTNDWGSLGFTTTTTTSIPINKGTNAYYRLVYP